jgi:hypothetical protein
VLEPCLRLASMFIDNFHIWSWCVLLPSYSLSFGANSGRWDTWLFGELTDVEEEPYEGTGKWLRRVHQREPETIFAEGNAMREAFLRLSKNLHLDIADGHTLPSDGLPITEVPGGWAGLTMFDYQLDRETVYLDYKMLKPLLMHDLTVLPHWVSWTNF